MSIAEKIGVHVPEVLLPVQGIDLHKWAVIACDQFTSQPEYWEKVAKTVGDAPSTFHLILPEAWLHSPDVKDRILKSQQAMQDYLDNGVLEPHKGFVFVERQVGDKVQSGLVVALDLECYDYNKGSQTLIRATEGTILDRLPPRMEVRRDALLESPHILVLYDDPEGVVLSEIIAQKQELPLAYDFELMAGSGHLSGRLIEKPALIDSVIEGLASLIDPSTYTQKYDLPNAESPLLFAMGDGNHSLATAKAIWEELKPHVSSDHPSRYALVELVNLHDPSLRFEPIHRVLFNPGEDFETTLRLFFADKLTLHSITDMPTLISEVAKSTPTTQRFGMIQTDSYILVELDHPIHNLTAGSLQQFLDLYLKSHPNTRIDYVHGDETVDELGRKPGNIGFFLPPIGKNSFFRSVIVDGALPRKTFSMNHAKDKRFYMECRRIKP
jgi:hypothetical protein